MTREEHISNLETIGCDGWTVTTEAYKSLQFAIETLEQEPCEDAISRQTVYEQINCWIGSGEYRYTNATDYLTKRVANLPSVQPEPKTGHWIWCGGSHKCSNCEEYTCFSFKKPPRYCPNCGAKMESEG